MYSIAINGVEIMQVSDSDISVMEYSIPSNDVLNLVSLRITIAVNDLLQSNKNLLQQAWLPLIRQRYTSMPTSDVGIGALIFSQPDYQDYDTRNAPPQS